MTYIMRASQFNAMHAAAIDLLERYHAGAEFAPETLQWARDLLTANPTPKRTPPRGLDQVAELFTPDTMASGMTVDAMAAIAPHLNAGKAETRHGTLYKLLYRLCKEGQLFGLRRKRLAALYFLTAEAREAVRTAPLRLKDQAAALRRAKFAEALQAIPKPVAKRKAPTQAQQPPATLFRPKPAAPAPASGSAFIPPPPPPVRAPSPAIDPNDPNDPRIQRWPTPKGRFEVTEADLKVRIFGGTAPGTNPMTGRAWE